MNPQCIQHTRLVGAVLALLALGLPARPARAQQTTGATFGDVIQLPGGTPSDVVLDESRHQLYLINNNTSLVYVLDYTTNTVVNTIAVGKTPLAGAISMDYHWLYVTNSGTPSLSVIDLTLGQVAQTVTLPSTPQGVEVGSDGRALISLLGTGVVAGVPQGTLLVFDRTQTSSNQLLNVVVPALPTTPVPIPAPTLPRPVTTFSGKLLRTPNGQFIVGVITPTAATTYVFVYEVASGVVLHNRTISGASSVLSMAPDGSRFMAGSSMFDIATLAVTAQQNNANAPFTFAGAVNTAQNTGGSVFSPDGTTIYSAFNTAASTTPAPPSLSSTLLVNDSTSLGIRLGIKLPESIVARIVMTADGSQAWGLSDSGLIHLPLGNLYNYPILMPQTTAVFLAMDDCNRGIASGTLQINNLGKGKLTFTVSTATSGALVYDQSTGLAPATITFSMEPGRSGVVRTPGTNIWTGAGTSNGTPFAVTLSSPEAINIPSLIRVYMNYRLPDQRGVIYPLPTTPNNNPAGNANPNGGNEGLQDMVLDEPHQKLYITNSGLNRIEVFDLQKQAFVNPIPVGQMPHQMALGTDGNTLYVGNTGGESISIVDLTLQQVVDNVVFPPLPRNGTVNPINPRSLAVGLFGLQFLMSDGSQWELVGTAAVPRPANTVTPVLLAGCPACGMMATPDNKYILTLNGSGTAYIYDGTADTYVATRLLFPAPIEGYYGVLGAGPAGSFFLANGLTLSPSLTTMLGTATPPAGGRNVAAVAPLGATGFLELTTPVRASATATVTGEARTTLQMVNTATGNATEVGVVPENPVVTLVGTARFNTTPRQLVVNAAQTTAYAITLSGLSVISLAPTGTGTLPAINPTRGIVNSADGTSTNIQPGSFITITGTNLASTATASTIPPPTVLGGSCVTFGDISVPLLGTSSGQIMAQVPDTLLPGTQVVEVRSLANAQDSAPVTVAVRAATTTPPATKGAVKRRPGSER